MISKEAKKTQRGDQGEIIVKRILTTTGGYLSAERPGDDLDKYNSFDFEAITHDNIRHTISVKTMAPFYKKESYTYPVKQWLKALGMDAIIWVNEIRWRSGWPVCPFDGHIIIHRDPKSLILLPEPYGSGKDERYLIPWDQPGFESLGKLTEEELYYLDQTYSGRYRKAA